MALVSGCSSSSGSTKSPTVSSGASSVTAPGNPASSSKAPIVIGVAVPLTGPFSAVSGTAGPIAQAWAQWVNKDEGGINGHPVQVIVKDTKSDAAAATSALTELVQQDKAIAIVVGDAAIEAPMATYLSSKDIPVIGALGDDPTVWNKYPDYFDLFGLTSIGTNGELQAAQTAGVKKYGAMVCAEVPVCAQEDAAFKSLSAQYGLSYEGYVTVAATAPSFTAECLSMISKKVDEIVLSLGASTIQGVARDCAQQGYTGYYGVSSTSVSAKSFAATPNFKTTGVIDEFPWWSNAAPVQQYRSVIKQFGPKADPETPAATGTWASLELFRKTMANVGANPTSADVLTAYGHIKNETLNGLLPAPVTFTQGQPSPAIKCAWLYSYSDGTFKTEASGTAGNGATGDLASSCTS